MKRRDWTNSSDFVTILFVLDELFYIQLNSHVETFDRVS